MRFNRTFYRRAAGSALVLLSSFAFAPTFRATADHVPPQGASIDECCDIAGSGGNQPHPRHRERHTPHYILDDRDHDERAAADFADGSVYPEGGPTFASNEHRGSGHSDGGNDPLTYDPAFHWSGPGHFGSGGGGNGGAGGDNPQGGDDAGTTPGGDNGGNGGNGNGNGNGGNGGNGDGNGNATEPGTEGNLPDHGGPNTPDDRPVADVPEPPSIALLAIGVIGLIVMRRRVRR